MAAPVQLLQVALQVRLRGEGLLIVRTEDLAAARHLQHPLVGAMHATPSCEVERGGAASEGRGAGEVREAMAVGGDGGGDGGGARGGLYQRGSVRVEDAHHEVLGHARREGVELAVLKALVEQLGVGAHQELRLASPLLPRLVSQQLRHRPVVLVATLARRGEQVRR